jgi:hypothetical protein
MKKYMVALAVVAALFATAALADSADNEDFTTASCTSSTGAALAANTSRVAALLINDGTSSIYLKIGEAAVASEGIRLNANGGSYYMSLNEGNLDREAVNCITASATVVLMVTEWSN